MFKGQENKTIKILDLLSFNGIHHTFLCALISNLKYLSPHVVIDKNALGKYPPNYKHIKIFQSPSSLFLRLFNYLLIALREISFSKKMILISGANFLSHLFLSLFLNKKNRAVIFHDEFDIENQTRKVSNLLVLLAIKIYRLRKIRVVVLSEHTYKYIIKKNLYDKNLLYVLTHPLLDIEAPMTYHKSSSLGLIGCLRKQKLAFNLKMFRYIKKKFNVKFVVFGYDFDGYIKRYESFFEVRVLLNKIYDNQSLLSFLRKYRVGTLLFQPTSTYRTATSGLICDATRLGLYVLGPLNFGQGRELVGDLYYSDFYNLKTRRPSPHQIKLLVHARRIQNVKQMHEIITF